MVLFALLSLSSTASPVFIKILQIIHRKLLRFRPRQLTMLRAKAFQKVKAKVKAAKAKTANPLERGTLHLLTH